MTPHEHDTEPHSEEILQDVEEEIAQDDVVDKVDQLLSRHHPKPPDAGDLQALPESGADSDASDDDGIPTLTDIVSTSYVPANRRAASNPEPIDDALILHRLEATLETVRGRVRSQIGENVDQARLLDQLVAVLKLALPEAVRTTGTEPVTQLAQPGEASRL
jgi:hypothetical protein